MKKRLNIMGCPVDSLDMQDTILEVEKYIKSRTLCQHVVVNVAKFMAMQNDTTLKKIISSTVVSIQKKLL